VDVGPNVKDNTDDIKYIYNNALTNLQNQISTTVRNELNASEVLTGFNSQMTGFQTKLSDLGTKETRDVTTLQGQINTNYTTLDNKYSQLVTNLANNQSGLQSQITTLSTAQQANNGVKTTNSNTWSNEQIFTNSLTVRGGLTTITRDMIIGSNPDRLLTINSTPTFNGGLIVASGLVSFPSRSIDASSIANLPTGLSVSSANTWTNLQTFNSGISTNTITNSGSLTVSGDATIGTSSANTLTINSSPILQLPYSIKV